MSTATNSSTTRRSQSRAHSRSRSRHRTRDSHDPVPYLPTAPDALLLPEDSITEENVQLLHEFVHPSHGRDKRRADTEDTLVAETGEPIEINEAVSESDYDEDDNEEDWEALEKRPWYRRPSPFWLLCTSPISSIAMSACAAPRVEIYTLLACREHKLKYNPEDCHHDVDVHVNMDNALQPVNFDENVDMPPFNVLQYPLLLGLDTILPSHNTIIGTLKESKDTSKCASDPVVQAAAAKIIAVLTTTMGILSCLTTAFWGSLSDRYGRLRVLSISIVGLLCNDVIFISVFFFSRQLPGGYWFLLLGPIIEGVLGGFASMVATIHAYIADVTPPGERSRQFSLGAGLLFVGMALGPSFGALLVHWTRTPMAVFYLATSVNALLALYMCAIVPESLPKQAQRANRRQFERRRLDEARAEEREAMEQGEEVGWKIRCFKALGRTRNMFSFLSPLSVFAPAVVETGGKKRRDWDLAFIAASFGFSMFVLASYQYKFQYAAAQFHWTSEELGYWLSLVGGSRAFYLTLILPFIIKFFNRPKQPIQLPIEPSEPLNTGNATLSEPSSSALVDSLSPANPQAYSHRSQTSDSPSTTTSPHTLSPHTPTFDLRLARISLMWEVICFALIPLAPNAYVFSIAGCLAAWGGGFGPAVQSLALEMYMRRNAAREATDPDGGEVDVERAGRRKGKEMTRQGEAETGRLFGAMSVVQSMCSQIFGPTLFGLVYMNTVSYFPTAIFWVSTMCISIALLFMLLVRLPPSSAGGHVHIPGHIPDNARESDVDLENSPVGLDREATLVDVRDDTDAILHRTKKGNGKISR